MSSAVVGYSLCQVLSRSSPVMGDIPIFDASQFSPRIHLRPFAVASGDKTHIFDVLRAQPQFLDGKKFAYVALANAVTKTQGPVRVSGPIMNFASGIRVPAPTANYPPMLATDLKNHGAFKNRFWDQLSEWLDMFAQEINRILGSPNKFRAVATTMQSWPTRATALSVQKSFISKRGPRAGGIIPAMVLTGFIPHPSRAADAGPYRLGDFAVNYIDHTNVAFEALPVFGVRGIMMNIEAGEIRLDIVLDCLFLTNEPRRYKMSPSTSPLLKTSLPSTASTTSPTSGDDDEMTSSGPASSSPQHFRSIPMTAHPPSPPPQLPPEAARALQASLTGGGGASAKSPMPPQPSMPSSAAPFAAVPQSQRGPRGSSPRIAAAHHPDATADAARAAAADSSPAHSDYGADEMMAEDSSPSVRDRPPTLCGIASAPFAVATPPSSPRVVGAATPPPPPPSTTCDAPAAPRPAAGGGPRRSARKFESAAKRMMTTPPATSSSSPADSLQLSSPKAPSTTPAAPSSSFPTDWPLVRAQLLGQREEQRFHDRYRLVPSGAAGSASAARGTAAAAASRSSSSDAPAKAGRIVEVAVPPRTS